MSRTEQKDARVLQDATGAKYQACLTEVRRRRALRDWAAYEAFYDRVDALPDRDEDGPVRCIRCLQLPGHDWKRCAGD